MKWLALVLLAGCVTFPTPAPVKPTAIKPEVVALTPSVDSQAELRAVVNAFVAAAEARRFEQVLPLLAKPLRDRYSAKTLERDFGADPLASERLGQIKSKLTEPAPFAERDESANFRPLDGGHLRVHDRSATLEWAPGRSLRLKFESAAESWRIAALE